jgi:hypothetical protein
MIVSDISATPLATPPGRTPTDRVAPVLAFGTHRHPL